MTFADYGELNIKTQSDSPTAAGASSENTHVPFSHHCNTKAWLQLSSSVPSNEQTKGANSAQQKSQT